MFAFGTNDYGTIRCSNGRCSCYCETAASVDATCKVIQHKGFRLYAFKGIKGTNILINTSTSSAHFYIPYHQTSYEYADSYYFR